MAGKGKKINRYRQDGVNIAEGDSFSAFAGKICQATYGFSEHVRVLDMSAGNFRGPRGYTLINVPEGCVQTMAADGPGTKVVLIDATQMYHTVAYDVFAMTATDITRWGGYPFAFSSVLDTSSLGEEGSPTNRAARAVISGAFEAAKESHIVILTGETAELGPCVGSENPDATFMFNWAAVMSGLYHPAKMILGQTLREGQIIMALKEDGFRANGYSSVRTALRMVYGPNWWANPAAQADIKLCAKPSILYDRLLTYLNGWHEPNFEPLLKIHLLVHLSGGAIESKLAKDILFPRGFSAVLDNLYEPPEIMKRCATWRGLSEEECYSTWHGGQGMLAVIDAKDEASFLDFASLYGIKAQKCGTITKKSKPQVTIASKFGSGLTIVFRPESKKKK